MSEIVLVMPEQRSTLTDELAATLSHELGRQDVPARASPGGFPADRLGQVHILIEPQLWLRERGAAPAAAVLRRTIVLLERTPAAGDEALLELLDGAGAVFVSDSRQAVSLRRISDLQPRVLRPGYSDWLDRFDPDIDRDLDVFVIGGDAGYLDGVAPSLAGRAGAIAERGQSRLQALSRTKVAINLHAGAESQLEFRQVLDAIHCGAVVVSEHSDGISPLEVGEHLLVGARESLPLLADALLRDPGRLARMRVAAYERLRTWMPYALAVSVLRAAIVELVGEPVASGG
ncbi:MAG: hypothetical protein WAL22_02920 [Solirubrobacteraceae bacterium]